MSEGDPFSDLDDKMGKAMETEPDGEQTTESEDTTGATEDQQSTKSTDTTQSEESKQSTKIEKEPDPLNEPGFPSGNDLNRSVYVRDSTWSDFDDAIDIELRPRLKRSGVSDIQKRELHDAALQVAIENPEAVVSAFLETRGVPKDEADSSK